MILLSKLDQTPVLLGLETIKYIEAVPDSVVHFTNGETIIVRESLSEIDAKIVAHRSGILAALRERTLKTQFEEV